MKTLLFSPKYTNAKNLDVEEVGELDYFSPQPIAKSWPKQVRIRLQGKKKPQDYFPVGPLRIVSSQFKDVCDQLEVGAEFLPIQLLAKDGSDYGQKHYALHILDCVDCMDLENSECTFEDDETEVDEVLSLAIHEEKALGHHLFLVDAPEFIILASDEFADAVAKQKLTGAVFLEPEQWSVSS